MIPRFPVSMMRRARHGPPVKGYSAWFNADSLGLANNAAVPKLTDSGIGGKDATPSGDSNRGTYRTAVLHGHAVVHFDGSTTAYSTASALTVGTFFIVCNHEDGATFTNYRRVIDAGDSDGWSLFGIQSSTSYNPTSAFPRDLDPTNFWINGSLSVVHIPLLDYRVISAVLSPTNPVSQVINIGFIPVASQSLLGNIAEYVFYDHALSSTERQSVEAYLMTKYGITS